MNANELELTISPPLSESEWAQLRAMQEANDKVALGAWAQARCKATVKTILEKARADHLDAAAGLKQLLSQIDQASPWLLYRFYFEATVTWPDEKETIEDRFRVRDFRWPSLDDFLLAETMDAAERAKERAHAEKRANRGRQAVDAGDDAGDAGTDVAGDDRLKLG